MARNWKIGWRQRKNKAPKTWDKISKVLKFFFGAMVPIITGTPVFSSRVSDIIVFCLGAGIVALSTLDMLLGDNNADTDVPVTRHEAPGTGPNEVP